MAISEIYVDPSIAADSGTGTIVDPFGDLEYAIKQTTFDTTNGTRVNIKAGTDEVVSVNNAVSVAMADTSVTAEWVPSVTAPLVFQGYTSTAGDGGIGGISGGGLNAIFFNHSYTHLIDLHVHNCGAAIPIRLAAACSVINCHVENTTSRAIYITNSGVVSGCYVHDCGLYGIDIAQGVVSHNVVTNNGTKTLTRAILIGTNCIVQNNIIQIDSTSDGIVSTSAYGAIDNNSIFSNGGSGAGISFVDTNAYFYSISNNLIEGFSGSGGKGIEITGAGLTVAKFGANSIYNCETASDDPTVLPGMVCYDAPANETLTASPFTDAANLDMSPVDTGSVKEGSYPGEFWTV